MKPLRGSILAASALAVSLTLACGGDGEVAPASTPVPTATATATPTPSPTPVPTPTPSPTPAPLALTSTPAAPPTGADQAVDPDRLLERSAQAMARVESFHFDISGRIKVTSGEAVAEIPISYVGDARSPDRTRGKLTLSVVVFALEIDIVTVGETTYTTNPQSGGWEVSNSGSLGVLNPAGFLGGGTPVVTGASYVGEEARGGERVHHLTGVADLGAVTEMEGETTADVWIGAEDLLVREVAVESPVELDSLGLDLSGAGLTGSGVASLSIRLSAYGAPVSIEAPIGP